MNGDETTHPNRRSVLHALTAAASTIVTVPSIVHAATPITIGAAGLAADQFAALAGKRIGLITNHTGRIGQEHLADRLHRMTSLRLAAILAPEHGFRGTAEAGAAVRDGRDPKTGVPVFSLYGSTRKPTPAMLRDIDILVFDIQDIGVRFYTYISTMGLAMQAAATRGITFLVLDRPNPIGGEDVSGFVLEPAFKSFVGQYPIPIVHGLTVGELARMIKGERWLPGLDHLDLQVMPLSGWSRAMRWPQTALPWIATSPNIPTFEAALAYPGIGIVGETLANEGRGTSIPFSQFGTPWLDAEGTAQKLTSLRLPGVRFAAASYTPQSITNVAAHPRFEGEQVNAVRIAITDVAEYRPLEVGIHALALLQREARSKAMPLLENTSMFNKIAGTRRLYQMLDRGADGGEIIAAWQDEVRRFKTVRARYLAY